MIFRNKKYQRELVTPCQDGILCKGCAFYDEPSACIGILREALPTNDKPEECLCVGETGDHYIFKEV